MKIRPLLQSTYTLVLFVLCAGSTSSAFAQVRRPSKSWTVMIYMAADNNLGPYALQDLYEMEAAPSPDESPAPLNSNEKINILVQLDTPGNNGVRRYRIQPSNERYQRRLQMKDFERRTWDQVQSPVLEELPEDSARTGLSSFVDWGKQNFPAKNTWIVVWGHGRGLDGWGWDETNGELQPLSTLENVSSSLLTFDACLMQTLEINSVLSSKTVYLSGSPQVQEWVGLPYRSLLKWLGSEQNVTPAQLASALPLAMKDSLKRGGEQGRFSTESRDFLINASWDRRKLFGPFTQALLALSKSLTQDLREQPLRKVSILAQIQDSPGYARRQLDLAAFLFAISENEQLSKSSRRLAQNAYQKLLSAQLGVAGGKEVSPRQAGLSAWVPASREEWNAGKKQLPPEFLKNYPEWIEWIQMLFSAGR